MNSVLMIEQSVRWVEERIGNITKNLDRRRIPLNNAERKKKEGLGKYPYVGANNILGYIDDYIFDEKILCIAEDGGSWGYGQTCAFIMNEKCWVNNHAHVVIAKDNLVLEYLKYYLNYTDLSLHINGATRGKLNQSALNNIKIPLPPLAEQQKIAAILDAADSLRQKDQQLIEHYTALSQSLFLEMFGDPVGNPMGWDILILEDMIEFLTSGSRGWAKYYSETGDLFLRIQNIGKNRLLLNDVTFVKPPVSAEAKRTKVEAGDILLSITADLGRTAVIPIGFPQAYINQHLAIIRLKNKYLPFYVSEYISSIGGKRQFMQLDKGGVKAGLNFSDIKSLKIPNPPITLQNQFAETIQAIEAQKQQAQASLEKSETLFNSLLQRAFKG